MARLSQPQLIAILRKAGFRDPSSLRTMYGIMMRESSGDPSAYNGNSGTGDQSYGLAQINMLGNLGPSRRQQYGLKSNEQLLDALTNARVAYRLSKGGKDFGAWGIGPNAYRSGAGYDTIAKYVNAFPGTSTGAIPNSQTAAVPAMMPVSPRLSPEQVFGGGSLSALFDSLSRQRNYLQSLQAPAAVTNAPANAAGQGKFKPGGGWGGSKNIARQIASIGLKDGLKVTSEKRTRKLTASGNPSDHWTGSKRSYAYDISGSVANMDRSAKQILGSLGIEWDGKSPIVENKIIGNHRIQILYRTNVGGNHFDHIHIGVKKL